MMFPVTGTGGIRMRPCAIHDRERRLHAIEECVPLDLSLIPPNLDNALWAQRPMVDLQWATIDFPACRAERFALPRWFASWLSRAGPLLKGQHRVRLTKMTLR